MPVATSTTRRYAAELHKRARRPALTRRVWVQGEHALNHEWTCDSWHMTSWQKGINAGKNGGFKYVAVYLDVFSRYAWTVPLKTLTAAEQLQAFQKVRKEARATPAILWSDNGSEYAGPFAAALKKLGIKEWSTFSPHKAAIAERCIRTLGERLYREMTATQSSNWATLLPKVTADYNHAIHSALGCTPAQAQDEAREASLWRRQYGDLADEPNAKPAFAVGDSVRVSLNKGLFEKGRAANWSAEVYTIAAVKQGPAPVYSLENQYGKAAGSNFYEAEPQRTSFSNTTQATALAELKPAKPLAAHAVTKVLAWRRNAANKSKFGQYELLCKQADGKELWRSAQEFVGIGYADGSFKSTPFNPRNVLYEAVAQYMQEVPELRAGVWDEVE